MLAKRTLGVREFDMMNAHKRHKTEEEGTGSPKSKYVVESIIEREHVQPEKL